ncbi:MAG: hypothetical protein IT437_03940 [Phycisphaerales bacterium]|nr:hypothetical protein [Phycisphaerales bacterium]
MTTVHLGLLDSVRIASPCPMRWEHMSPVGDGRTTRHCGQCDLHVHNLSAMTRDEAESFLASRAGGGRTCAGFFRRADGTILTRDCPVGVRALRAAAVRTAGRVAAAVVLVVGGIVVGRSRPSQERLSIAAAAPFRVLSGLVGLRPAPQSFIAGSMVFTPRPPAASGN